MLDVVQQRRDAILEIASRYHARNVRVFGSVARGDSHATSDIDFLVEFDPGTSLWDRGGMWSELNELFECAVDLSDEKALREELRDEVLREAVAV